MTPGPIATRAVLRVALLGAALLLVAAPPGLSQPPARHVIIVSFDGLRADALQSVWPARLRQQGAASWSARTVLPSSTLPAHTSMVTGVGPEVHGVRFNDWQPDQDRLSRTTIFTRVRAAGGRVAVLVTKQKLLFLVPPDVPAEWLLFPRYRQGAVIAEAAQRFREQRPALLFVHVADPDDAGHRSGWMSPPYLAVVAQIPGLVEGLLAQVHRAGRLAQTLLIVTADHGGHGRTHGTDRPEDITIPWVALGGLARAGVTLQGPIATYDTAVTTLYALGISLPAWQGRPVREALDAVPAGR